MREKKKGKQGIMVESIGFGEWNDQFRTDRENKEGGDGSGDRMRGIEK